MSDAPPLFRQLVLLRPLFGAKGSGRFPLAGIIPLNYN